VVRTSFGERHRDKGARGANARNPRVHVEHTPLVQQGKEVKRTIVAIFGLNTISNPYVSGAW